MANILVSEQVDETYVVTRGRKQVAHEHDLPSARIAVSSCYEDGDQVHLATQDGQITNITRSVLRSLTRNRSRSRQRRRRWRQ